MKDVRTPNIFILIPIWRKFLEAHSTTTTQIHMKNVQNALGLITSQLQSSNVEFNLKIISSLYGVSFISDPKKTLV